MPDQGSTNTTPPSNITTQSSVTAPTVSTIGTGSQVSGQNQGNQGGNNKNNKWNKNKTFGKWDDFSGDTEGLCVIGLRHERFKLGEITPRFLETVQRYIVREYESGADVRPAFDGKDPIKMLEKNEPFIDIDTSATESEKFNAGKKLDALWTQHGKRQEKLRRNIQKAYALVMGQCSKALRSELKAMKDYVVKDESCDLVWLIKSITKATAGVDEASNKQLVLSKKLMEFMDPKGETRQR